MCCRGTLLFELCWPTYVILAYVMRAGKLTARNSDPSLVVTATTATTTKRQP